MAQLGTHGRVSRARLGDLLGPAAQAHLRARGARAVPRRRQVRAAAPRYDAHRLSDDDAPVCRALHIDDSDRADLLRALRGAARARCVHAAHPAAASHQGAARHDGRTCCRGGSVHAGYARAARRVGKGAHADEIQRALGPPVPRVRRRRPSGRLALPVLVGVRQDPQLRQPLLHEVANRDDHVRGESAHVLALVRSRSAGRRRGRRMGLPAGRRRLPGLRLVSLPTRREQLASVPDPQRRAARGAGRFQRLECGSRVRRLPALPHARWVDHRWDRARDAQPAAHERGAQLVCDTHGAQP